MAKMTPARAARWQKDLNKALDLVRRTYDDLGSAKVSASGTDNYSDLIDAGGLLVVVVKNLEGLVDADIQRSAISRIFTRLTAAAEERKRLKAERDAAKAAAQA
jgi:hypothetical protein